MKTRGFHSSLKQAFSALGIAALVACGGGGNGDGGGNSSITSKPQAPVVQAPTPLAKKPWTIAFYDAADSDDMFDPFDTWVTDLIKHSDPNTNYIVLRDTNTGAGEGVYWIDETGKPILVQHSGEPQMNSSKTLSDFLTFVHATYPSEKIALAIYDHGGGWVGACMDTNDGTSRDYTLMSMGSMANAIQQTGGVDLLMFSAPCLMGATESMYQARNAATVYIGSEDTSGFLYWFSAWMDMAEALSTQPSLGPEELARIALNGIQAHLNDGGSWWPLCTMSAVRSSDLPKVSLTVGALVDWLLAQDPSVAGKALLNAYYRTMRFDRAYNMLDLGDLVKNLKQEISDPAWQTLCDQTIAAIQTAVIQECHGTSQEGATGMSIYFPDIQNGFIDSRYGWADNHLDFISDTGWAKLFQLAYEAASKS